MERKLLLAYVVWRLKKSSSEAIKANEKLLKVLGINAKEAELLVLDLLIEACELLKSQVE